MPCQDTVLGIHYLKSVADLKGYTTFFIYKNINKSVKYKPNKKVRNSEASQFYLSNHPRGFQTVEIWNQDWHRYQTNSS